MNKRLFYLYSNWLDFKVNAIILVIIYYFSIHIYKDEMLVKTNYSKISFFKVILQVKY